MIPAMRLITSSLDNQNVVILETNRATGFLASTETWVLDSDSGLIVRR